jgi:MarR family transcriptional regulator, lower aerobic nicotinate degradation pathway regulator
MSNSSSKLPYRTQPLPGGLHPALAGCTGFALSLCARAGDTLFARALAGISLSPPLFAVLVLLESEGAQPQARLADTLAIDKATMVRLVDALEALGYARRRPHLTDARAVLVSLEPTAKKVLREARKHEARVQTELLAGLSPEEKRTLHLLLVKVAAQVPSEGEKP